MASPMSQSSTIGLSRRLNPTPHRSGIGSNTLLLLHSSHRPRPFPGRLRNRPLPIYTLPAASSAPATSTAAAASSAVHCNAIPATLVAAAGTSPTPLIAPGAVAGACSSRYGCRWGAARRYGCVHGWGGGRRLQVVAARGRPEEGETAAAGDGSGEGVRERAGITADAGAGTGVGGGSHDSGVAGGGGRAMDAEQLLTLAEEYVDAWWRGVARGADAVAEALRELVVQPGEGALAPGPTHGSLGERAPHQAATAASTTHTSSRRDEHHAEKMKAATSPLGAAQGPGGAAVAAGGAASRGAGSGVAAQEAAAAKEKAEGVASKREARPAGQAGTGEGLPKDGGEGVASKGGVAAAGEAKKAEEKGLRREGEREREDVEAAAAAGEGAAGIHISGGGGGGGEVELVPDGVLHKRPLRGYDALISHLAVQHTEYHRVQYRPVVSAASAPSHCAFVLGEYRMQDVGGLAGHPATFRVSRGYCLYKLAVDPHSGRIVRGWVRRQLTQEERDERVWDPVHVYPAPFPLEHLHLTRGGRPDPRVMEEAACAWVAAQATAPPQPPPPEQKQDEEKETDGKVSTSAEHQHQQQQQTLTGAKELGRVTTPGGQGGGEAAVDVAASSGGPKAEEAEGAGAPQAALSDASGDEVSEPTSAAPAAARTEPNTGGEREATADREKGSNGAGSGVDADGGLQSISTAGFINSVSPHVSSLGGAAGEISSTGSSAAGRESGGGGSSSEHGGSGGGDAEAAPAPAPAPAPAAMAAGGVEGGSAAGGKEPLSPVSSSSSTTAEASEAAAAVPNSPAVTTTRAQARLTNQILAEDCRLLDAYGIWPGPEEDHGPYAPSYSGTYGGRRPQAVVGAQRVLHRIQAQQQRCLRIEPVLRDVAVSEDHNIAFVHWTNTIVPAPEPATPAAAPAAPLQQSAAAKLSPSAAALSRTERVYGRGAADVAAVSTAAASVASAAAQAASAAADAATTAASAASVAATSANTAATIAATAATAAAFIAQGEAADVSSSRSSKGPDGAVAPSALPSPATPLLGPASEQGATAKGAASAQMKEEERQKQKQPAAVALEERKGAAGAAQIEGSLTAGSTANNTSGGSRSSSTGKSGVSSSKGGDAAEGSSSGGGSTRPLGLQDLRIPMPQLPQMPQMPYMQMPIQIQNLEDALSAAAQRVAGAAGTAAAAASAAAAAATAVIRADAAAAAASTGARDQPAATAAAAAPTRRPPPAADLPYHQDCMAALLFHDDGTISDVWLFRGPFHFERRMLRP
ncbi:hypothetical protein Agub_g12321 [Astrephomene gubernaculifera]|uniref:Uncharacterized protein n=1 Tax=Astrephomene gubernaculifera TaxID=47775 RepID=A0AAD3HRQ5_9CHLO|nr:hypothetical protein Agub_g12321 [Astrephomene gubernaculifera]